MIYGGVMTSHRLFNMAALEEQIYFHLRVQRRCLVMMKFILSRLPFLPALRYPII